MRTKLFLAIALLCIFLSASAQKDEKEYQQRAQDIQTEMWSNPAQPFSVKTIPSTMDSESAVIIATSFDVVNSAKMKMKWSALTAIQRMYYQTTYHERVKINDK